MPTPITIVTATTRPEATEEFWSSWVETAVRRDLLSVVVVVNGPNYQTKAGVLPGHELGTATVSQRAQLVLRYKEYLGTVPAFAQGCANASSNEVIVACFHDDLQLLERGWDEQLRDVLGDTRVGLAGFGGATSVGEEGMYDKPFNPMTLARHGFMSNLRDAEQHGERVEEQRQVAVLDGFSQCFAAGLDAHNLFATLDELGIIHHAYDVALGCLVHQLALETWFVPVACHHAGGQTAVGDAGYQEWAKQQCPAGDQGIWWHAHQAVWRAFDDVLPFGV